MSIFESLLGSEDDQMEWINQKTRFSAKDRENFAFDQDAKSFRIRTFIISKSDVSLRPVTIQK